MTVTMGSHQYRIIVDITTNTATVTVDESHYGNRNGEYAIAVLESVNASISIHMRLE